MISRRRSGGTLATSASHESRNPSTWTAPLATTLAPKASATTNGSGATNAATHASSPAAPPIAIPTSGSHASVVASGASATPTGAIEK
jgi:hypothetical protein